MKKLILFLLLIFFVSITSSFCQKVENNEVKDRVQAFKKDVKGPYQQIMWFCPDGTKVPPKQRCLEKGGVQRATYKTWVETLAKNNHIYIGQILSATKVEDFLDEQNQFSRLKQYQIENYLRAIDNGWVLQRAKFYRGAFQDEDENAWGAKFLEWVINNKQLDDTHFFTLRQAFKDIPHKAENSNIQKIRALSMEIADSIPKFMDLRIKIHGQPEAKDLLFVKEFQQKNSSLISNEIKAKFTVLIKEMEIQYQDVNWQSLSSFLKPLGTNSASGKILQSKLSEIGKANSVAQRIQIASNYLLDIRKSLADSSPKTKLVLFDLSNRIEDLIFREIPQWQTTTLTDLFEKNYALSIAAVGAGYIELWEWDKIASEIKAPTSNDISLAQLNNFMVNFRRVVEWSTATIRANYGEEIKLFENFEPLASGFSDDRIRSSVLLSLGQSVAQLGTFINTKSSLTNKVFNISNQSHIRGINPGFSKGELVVRDSPEGLEISADKIYVFLSPPSDLKPVAGIATVSEGNLVSHVQLLARNLGIPNAVVSQQNLTDLKAFAGKHIFYAVSNKGTVIMKLVEQMTAEEKALFEVKKRTEEKIRVPIDKMDLKQDNVLNLRQVNATSSGKVCGPKAANLGQLKLMFPENVVEGIVIPFGIFKQHMDQAMPGENRSYWEFLNSAFLEANQMKKAGKNNTETEAFLIKKLGILRDAIQKMPLLPWFVDDFKNQFKNVLGKPVGELPVFVRSDTNMEDLKDFTGAGLNLTLFNVVDEEKIFQGIKQVWSSPYSERSFQWRQSYLLNPENVFPSILVIPSVNVDYSGVLITKGVSMGDASDLTIAFSRGVGGAVDGQAAESYLLSANGKNTFLAPSREAFYSSLPLKGGTLKTSTNFKNPILNSTNLTQIRDFAQLLKKRMAETKGMQAPFDVELGFLNNKLWLFQVRPFVENRNAAGAIYLESITPKIDEEKRISLSEKL